MPQIKGMESRAYRATHSLLRFLRKKDAVRKEIPAKNKNQNRSGLKIAFIYGEKKVVTGADHINRLMAQALTAQGARVRAFYPRIKLVDTPTHLRGLANILFFHSLLEHKTEILKHDIIQGTTYTPLPFLTFSVPVVSHFGSTTRGFLECTPRTAHLSSRDRNFYRGLHKLEVIPEMDFKTFKPLEDAADIEELVAARADACVATSKKVKGELVEAGVPEERIHVIHNAIEDYWFSTEPPLEAQTPHLVFLGRLGGDIFTLKLKGFDRMAYLYNAFPSCPKTTVCMTVNKALKEWTRVAFSNHHLFVNIRKDIIPNILRPLYGSILLVTSRYEGFSLSMVEGMSQGLVPVAFPVGVVEELIENGVNGYVVSTVEEAKERIDGLLRDPERRLRMAKAARESTEQFHSERIARELLNLYRTLKGNRKKVQNGSVEEEKK